MLGRFSSAAAFTVLPTVAFIVCNSLPTAVTSTTTLLPPTCSAILMVVAWPMLIGAL